MKSRKGLKITALVLAILVLAYGIIALWPRGANFKPNNPMRKTGDMPCSLLTVAVIGNFPIILWRPFIMRIAWIRT